MNLLIEVIDDTGTTAYINPSHIVRVRPVLTDSLTPGNESLILMSDGVTIQTKTSPRDIANAIHFRMQDQYNLEAEAFANMQR